MQTHQQLERCMQRQSTRSHCWAIVTMQAGLPTMPSITGLIGNPSHGHRQSCLLGSLVIAMSVSAVQTYRRGYDLVAFAKHGAETVVGVEISESAVRPCYHSLSHSVLLLFTAAAKSCISCQHSSTSCVRAQYSLSLLFSSLATGAVLHRRPDLRPCVACTPRSIDSRGRTCQCLRRYDHGIMHTYLHVAVGYPSHASISL